MASPRPTASSTGLGIPGRRITADRVPGECTCSWAYSRGELTLKYFDSRCPLRRHDSDVSSKPGALVGAIDCLG